MTEKNSSLFYLMSDITKYLNLVEHDTRLLDLITGTRPDHLKDDDFSDWQVTIIFYMSCIYLKAVCVLFGEDVQDHYTLRQLINTRKEIYEDNIARYYRHIEEASRDARYEGRRFDKEFIEDRILPKFYKVKERAISILKDNDVTDIPETDIGFLLERL
jgi:hypothetical protein